ncbi:MAG: hypothetical protein RJA70_4871, partial [Pseudomonadota bacterium]
MSHNEYRSSGAPLEPVPSAASKPQPTRRWPRIFIGSALHGLVFVLALAFALVAHLDTPLLRSSAGTLLNRALSGLLNGEIVVERFTRLTATGFGVSKAELKDERGDVVIALEDLSVELDTLDDFWALALGNQELSLVFPHTRVERAHVRLLPNGQSDEPTLVRALELRPGPPRRAGSSHTPERPVRVFLAAVEIGQLSGELGTQGLSKLAPRLSQVHGNVLFSPEGIALDVQSFGLNLTGVLPDGVSGTGHLKLRSPGPLEVGFNGFAGNVEVRASAKLEGGTLQTEFAVPRATGDAVRAWLPSWPFQESVSFQVSGSGEWPKLQIAATATLAETKLRANGTLLLADSPTSSLDFELQHADLRSVAPALPETAIDASGRLVLISSQAGVELTITG